METHDFPLATTRVGFGPGGDISNKQGAVGARLSGSVSAGVEQMGFSYQSCGACSKQYTTTSIHDNPIHTHTMQETDLKNVIYLNRVTTHNPPLPTIMPSNVQSLCYPASQATKLINQKLL